MNNADPKVYKDIYANAGSTLCKFKGKTLPGETTICLNDGTVMHIDHSNECDTTYDVLINKLLNMTHANIDSSKIIVRYGTVWYHGFDCSGKRYACVFKIGSGKFAAVLNAVKDVDVIMLHDPCQEREFITLETGNLSSDMFNKYVDLMVKNYKSGNVL